MNQAFGSDKAQLLQKHLEAQLNVEFFTIPLYLNAVYSFTDAAVGYQAGDGTYPLYDLQQKTLSVAVQEMYHMQLACNLANAFDVTPQIDPSLRSFPAGQSLVVPHLEPDHQPLTTQLGNLPAVIESMIAVEKPDSSGQFPPPNPNVEYPSIGDLYHATLTLLSNYLEAYQLTPAALDPHFIPNHFQIAYGAFATRYRYNKIMTRDDVAPAANAITDQGEGREVAPTESAFFASGTGCDILPQFRPSGGRFAKYDDVTHYCRFEDIQAVLNSKNWEQVVGKPVFYTDSHVASPDLPDWAPDAATCQNALNLVWSYLLDVMMAGFQQGNLKPDQGDGIGFDNAMISLKYIVPLVWQHGDCPSYLYQSGVTPSRVQEAMDAVDPLCLFHWDARTAAVREKFPKEKNTCQGLNVCAGRGWGGIATTKGNGACATADFHTCQGNNDCSFEGGCGFLSTNAQQQLLPPSEQWIPGENQGATTGGCQTPVASLQVFDSSSKFPSDWPESAKKRLDDLKGTSVWEEARQLFAQRESIGTLPDPLSEQIGSIDYDGTKRRKAVAPTSKS